MTEQPERGGSADRREGFVPPHDSMLQRFVGQSPAAQAVREKLRAVGTTDASVLILGASGTGKELAAQLIHKLSARAGGTFVAIDGGALAEGLVESELFGHTRGAYTGAVTERRGLFEEAHKGTLFLDEVGNVPLGIQARLLRVLETREVRRVGDNRSRPVNVRVLAATNRDLFAEVRDGRFREDLLYRLDVVRLELPLLRDRREDVPVLVNHFLSEISERDHRGYDIVPAAVTAITDYDWPGNVRELRNVLESATALAGSCIKVEHLPLRVQGSPCPRAGRGSLRTELTERERSFILERLVSCNWNVTRAARSLGMSRQYLYERLHALGLWAKLKGRET